MKNQKRILKLNKKGKAMLIGITILISAFMIGLNCQFNNVGMEFSKQSYNYLASYNYLVHSKDNVKYLSDLDFIMDNNWSYNGWSGHEIQKDKNQDGGTLSLLVDDERRYYNRGIGLHATGQVTFDISELSIKFPRFIARIGVDASRGKNGSLWFQILVSNDGNSWSSLLKTGVMTGMTESIDVDLDVEGYKYLRIYTNSNGSNAADHGTIANARLVTKEFDKDSVFYDKIKPLDYYDNILNAHDVEDNYNNNYRLILEREFVNKIGYWSIQNLAESDENMLETFDWILSSDKILENIIEVGAFNSTKFIGDLSNIYTKHKNDLNTENGYVYQKMMIAVSAAHSSDIILTPLKFNGVGNDYDPLQRYETMKNFFDNDYLRIYKNNGLTGENYVNTWFKDYSMPLMRMVMHDGISNTDLIWLNGYSREKVGLNFWVIPYISPNYNQNRFFDETNRETYDNKYLLSKYGVSYAQDRTQHYWMVIEGGGICWNQSRFGQAMFRANGIPAVGSYQPGHEMFFSYYQDANGKGYWTGRYGNWGNAGSAWGGICRVRYPLDWGNKYFADQNISGSKGGTSSGYIYLAQANLNNYDEYKKSLYYNLVTNSYNDNDKKLDVFFKSLDVNELNLDTYDYIIDLYKKMSVKNEGGTITSHDWYELAKEIIDAYTYYPVGMFDLIKVIRPYLEGVDLLDINRLEKEALTKATQANSSQTNSAEGAKTHARQLLGKTQPDPISFSFDGENAGKLVKNPMYSLSWGYSLDGGKTFTNQIPDDSVTLTKQEIESITEENDIIINFMGLKDYTFRIDITKGTIGNNLFANDLENRVVGVTLGHEWRNSENDSWTSYKDSSPDNTGNKTLYVRKAASGTQLASDSMTYTFTEDNQPNTRKYVPVSHLSIESVSTEATNNQGSAINAIDGNYNTRWHSAWNGTDTQRFITIKLDKSRFVSAVEFVPAGGGNGKIYDGTIWGSPDGENWEILSQQKGLTYTNKADTIEQAIQNTKSFEIENPKEVQYIKIVADRTNGNWFTARNFNIYQDITKNPRPTAGIGYSENTQTTNNVIARLVNPSTNITITNNGGSDTYTFTKNGEFTFEFVDENGTKGTSTAKVDWIDREAPTATIEYSTKSFTNQTVVATLKPSEDIIVTNNGEYQIGENGKVLDSEGNVVEGYTVDNEGNVKDENGNIIANINTFTYEFLSNGEFTFEFMDRAGNKGRATAKVTWIDHDIPNATLIYDIYNSTNKNVTVTAEFDEDVIVINNDGSEKYTFTENGEFTFEFKDKAGNRNSITAKVNWIDKVAPTAKLKYEKFENKVIVHVVDPSEEITFQNGNGTYEFTKNGSYDIIFYDKVGNIGKVTAIIKDFNNNNAGNSSNQGGNIQENNNSGNNKPGNSTIINNGNHSSGNNTVNKDNETSSDKPTDSENNKPGDKDDNNKPNNSNQNSTSTIDKDNENVDNNKKNPKDIYTIIALIAATLVITTTIILIINKKR